MSRALSIPSLALLALSALIAAACEDGADAPTGPLAADFDPVDHVGAAFPGLLVELDYVAGHAPDAAVLERVERELQSLVDGGHLALPDGFRIVVDEELPAVGEDTVRTFEELDALAHARRSVARESTESVIHVLYVDGHYEEDGDGGLVLGLAWGGDRIAMFADNVERSCQRAGLPGPVGEQVRREICHMSEASVFLHELGHDFGLVANGVPMVEDHEDPDHPKHDVNEDCVMYWKAERGGVVDLVAERYLSGEGDASVFDEACRADLSAVANP